MKTIQSKFFEGVCVSAVNGCFVVDNVSRREYGQSRTGGDYLQ